FRSILPTLAGTCVLYLLIEGAFLILGYPQGACDFIERVILQQKLEFKKPAGHYRIFVYGESTVHGAGYAPTSSPVKWLDAYLRDFLPERNVQVINFGRLGEESDFIAQAFFDTLQYKPDLAIFYLGHNTFYPDNRVDFVKKRESEFKNRLRRLFRKSRSIAFVVRKVIENKIQRHSGKTEDIMGDGKIEIVPHSLTEESEEITVPGSKVYLNNVRFFQENIEKILGASNKSGVRALFMKPICNLKDYPPNFSMHSKTLSPEQLKLWDQFYQQGLAATSKKNDLVAIESFERALSLDPDYADLSFRLGQLYFQKGDLEKARSLFEQARDRDVVIRRAPQDILSVFEDLAKQDRIHYSDTEKALISRASGGIMGWPVIEDNVHFSLEGQALVGRALASEIAQNNWIAPRSEWRFERERPMEEIQKELGVTRRTVFWDYCSVISYLGVRYGERLEFAQRALELFPEDPIALRQLAWAYWLLGERDKSLSIYTHLREKDPSALEAVFRAQPMVQQAYESFLSYSSKS
ncbi:MAG: tetratricopeptide repeat protein, partial [Candidatus Omnitrophota bacterium]